MNTEVSEWDPNILILDKTVSGFFLSNKLLKEWHPKNNILLLEDRDYSPQELALKNAQVLLATLPLDVWPWKQSIAIGPAIKMIREKLWLTMPLIFVQWESIDASLWFDDKVNCLVISRDDDLLVAVEKILHKGSPRIAERLKKSLLRLLKLNK